VQRELFHRIKVANDAVARCTLVAPNHETKDLQKVMTAKDQWIVYKNFYWEIQLQIAEGGVKVRLKSLRAKQQRLDTLHFQIRFKDSKSEPILFPPLGSTFEASALIVPDKDKDGKDNGAKNKGAKDRDQYQTIELAGVDPGNLRGVFSVEQVLNWETAAVKRIDVVSIGAATNGDPAVSHRQAWRPLVPYKKKVKDDAPDPKAGDGGGGINKGIKFGESSGGGVGAGGDKLSKHGVVLDRYLEATSESRKLPINMVLIVDPEHLALVQAKLIETPLRFLTTQMMLQRSLTALQPPEPKTDGEPGSGTSMKTGGKVKGGFGDAAGAPGSGSPGSGTVDLQADLPEEQENIELTVYGVITIYERPGRPAPVAPAAPPPAKEG